LIKKRHQQYIILHNTNCDASRPKPRSALIKELAEWEERTMKKKVSSPDRGKAPMDPVEENRLHDILLCSLTHSFDSVPLS
jgi:hypothetical protein